MKKYIQMSLWVAAGVYLIAGLGLMLEPRAGHDLISAGPYDGTLVSMFVAVLFGLVVVFSIAAHDPVKQMVHAAASGLALVAVVMAYQMFINKAVPLGPATIIGFIVNAGVATYLFMFLTEAVAGHGGRHRMSRGHRMYKKKSGGKRKRK